MTATAAATALEQSIFGDMADLEKTLSEDNSGDRARSMLAYFHSVLEATERTLAGAADDAERHLVTRLQAGLRAADRIIRHVWETLHGSVLVA